MKEHFLEDHTLALFSGRFATKTFDPVTFRPVLSPATQCRPKAAGDNLSAAAQHVSGSSALGLVGNSPKRAAPFEDSDTDGERPRKLARGESPLKGAAGRRLNQQKGPLGHQHTNSAQPGTYSLPQPPPPPPPPSLPRDVLFLLSIIPRPDTYTITKFNAAKMVELFRDTEIPKTPEELRLLQLRKDQPQFTPQVLQRPTMPPYASTPPVSQPSYQMPQAAPPSNNFQPPAYNGISYGRG